MLVSNQRGTQARLDAMARGQPIMNELIGETQPVPPALPSIHG